MSVRERLKYLMEIYELDTAAAVSRATGVPDKTIRGILRRDAIGPKSGRMIANSLNINYQWLVEGKGPVEKRGFPKVVGEEAWPSGEEAEKAEEAAAALPVPPLQPVTPEEFVYIPKTKSRLAAGHGLIPDNEEYTERFAFRRNWLRSVCTGLSKVILMEVDGDSMYPTLRSGDTVLIDVGRTEVHGGGIYAFSSDDFILIKRLEWLGGGIIRIISDNAIYPPEEKPADEITIIGRCIWFGRTLL